MNSLQIVLQNVIPSRLPALSQTTDDNFICLQFELKEHLFVMMKTNRAELNTSKANSNNMKPDTFSHRSLARLIVALIFLRFQSEI